MTVPNAYGIMIRKAISHAVHPPQHSVRSLHLIRRPRPSRKCSALPILSISLSKANPSKYRSDLMAVSHSPDLRRSSSSFRPIAEHWSNNSSSASGRKAKIGVLAQLSSAKHRILAVMRCWCKGERRAKKAAGKYR